MVEGRDWMKEQQFEYYISWRSEPAPTMRGDLPLYRSMDDYITSIATEGWRLHSIVPDGVKRFMIVMERKSGVKHDR
jgi:hypothetical protein